MAGALGEGFYEDFSAFYVTAVDQHVEGSFLHDCLFEVFVSAVGVADYEDFHRSASLMARRAFPLWLILFFSSMESSAEVQPYSGR